MSKYAGPGSVIIGGAMCLVWKMLQMQQTDQQILEDNLACKFNY